MQIKQPIFRIRDLKDMGLSLGRLRTLVRTGAIQRIGRGQYLRNDVQYDENITLSQVAKAIPGGVICLLTALRYHGIGTQDPPQVWVGIDRKARLPKAAGLPIHVVRFSDKLPASGVEKKLINGVEVTITRPARTIVDTFRYRNKIGIDVAIEALREGLKSHKVTREELRLTAEACRAGTVIKPYLQAMS